MIAVTDSNRGKVPVGRAAARRYSESFGDLEENMLCMVDRLGAVTLAALARMYHNSPYTARDHMRKLCRTRYLERVPVNSVTVQRAMAYRPPAKNPTLCLGGNGYYYLRDILAYLPERRQAMQSDSSLSLAKLPHRLSVSEAIAYLVAVCRATHEMPLKDAPSSALDAPLPSVPYRCAVAVLNERQSAIYADTRLTLDRRINERVVSAGTAKPLLIPDATLFLSLDTSRGSSPYAELPVPVNARWNPTLQSWRAVLLTELLTPSEMRTSERIGATAYRGLLVEMETGMNNARTLQDKVRRYNRLYANTALHTALFGNGGPRVLLVVRTSDQVRNQAMLWRQAYLNRTPASVVVTSLQALSQAHNQSRRALLEERLWVDVMAPQRPQTRTFLELLPMLAASS
ncbi:MAG: hypothetical protein ABI670_01175 [Chloroflexota bacterium]